MDSWNCKVSRQFIGVAVSAAAHCSQVNAFELCDPLREQPTDGASSDHTDSDGHMSSSMAGG
jgi:hypothetical protein